MRTRLLVSSAVAIVVLSVLADPYTHHLDGSDGILDAPRWQTTLALLDVGILISGVIVVWWRTARFALMVLAAEALYSLAFNAALVYRDGVGRFIWGIGAERHFLDFFVAFALRLLVLIALLSSMREDAKRAA